jgi:hypothetical protein
VTLYAEGKAPQWPFELCSTLDTGVAIVNADKSFEVSGSLRPKLLQDLLENTRQIAANGVYDSEFQITVPKELMDGQDDSRGSQSDVP